ncbi:hypothetical protein KBC75_00315 [Candidatus Shapirobacteria bacterium]|nr:hypothetical protein [Candidatus Shapirobacteria bacterium]
MSEDISKQQLEAIYANAFKRLGERCVLSRSDLAKIAVEVGLKEKSLGPQFLEASIRSRFMVDNNRPLTVVLVGQERLLWDSQFPLERTNISQIVERKNGAKNRRVRIL